MTRLNMKWQDQRATRLQRLLLDGILPGGHARAPGQLDSDNIKITLEE